MVFKSLSAFLAFSAILFGVPVSLVEAQHSTCAYFKDAWDRGIPLNVCHGQFGGASESSTSYKFVCSPDQQHVVKQSYIGIDCTGTVIDEQIQLDHGFQCNGDTCPYYERFECSGLGCSSMSDPNFRCECPTWSTKYYLMQDYTDVNCIGDDKPDDECTHGNFVKNTCNNQLTFGNINCFPTPYPTAGDPPTTTNKPTPKPTTWHVPTPKPTWTTTTKKPTTWWTSTTTKKPTPRPTYNPTKKPTTTTKKPTNNPTKSPTPKPTPKPTPRPTAGDPPTTTTTKKPTWTTTTKKPTRKPTWTTTTKKPTWKGY